MSRKIRNIVNPEKRTTLHCRVYFIQFELCSDPSPFLFHFSTLIASNIDAIFDNFDIDFPICGFDFRNPQIGHY